MLDTAREAAEGPAPLTRRFWIAAAIAAVVPAAATVYVVLNLGTGAGGFARDVGQAIAALAAASSCGMLALRSAGRTRWAWGMIAVSGLATLVAELAAVVYSASVAEPSFMLEADAGIAGGMPFAIAGLLLFPHSTYRFATRWRALLDGAVLALSLACISILLSLPELVGRFAPGIETLLAVSLPILDVTLLTVIFVTLRRSPYDLRPRMGIVIAGLALVALSDAGAVVLAAGGRPQALAELLGSGSVYGFALVALAPFWPERREQPVEGEMPLWHELIPYFGVFAVALTAVVGFLTGLKMSSYVAIPATGLVLLLVASQLISRSEGRALLRESRQIQERLSEREALLNNVIDHAPQGVAAITADRRITNANPRLASMLYMPLPLLVGSSTDGFMPEDYVNRVFRTLSEPKEGEPQTYESDCQARRPDGTTFWLHWTATPVRAADGSLGYFMTTFEDVTAKREAEETAVANLAQLEKLNSLKSEFVATVSHEFRTALVGIQGFSELIRDQSMDITEVKVLAEEIYNDSQRLNRMITEMLDFDRLEAGKLRLDLKPIDLNELVRDTVEHASVTTRKHVLIADLEPGLPDVLGDEDRLTEVLTNLLSNAIKYSPYGGEIRAGTRLNSGFVEVSVRDHGRGIPPEFVSRLFGKYERYEDKHGGKIIGTGLGLAITRQIIEMHGGRITVHSVVGEGSEFRFTIPRAATATPAKGATTNPGEAPGSPGIITRSA